MDLKSVMSVIEDVGGNAAEGYDTAKTLKRKPGSNKVGRKPPPPADFPDKESHYALIKDCSSESTNSNKEGKWITVFLNGDELFPGKRVLINPVQIRSFESLLNLLTEKLDPIFGAVRKLFNIQSMRPVYSLNELEDNGKYAASGGGRFRRLKEGYKTEEEKQNAEGDKKEDSQSSLNMKSDLRISKVLPFFQVQCMKKMSRTMIYVFANGSLDPPAKFVLIPRDIENWNETLDLIAKRLRMFVGGVASLYTLAGEKVVDPRELQNGGCYVAVGFYQKFKRRDYIEYKNPNTGPYASRPQPEFWMISNRSESDESSRTSSESIRVITR